MQPLSDRLKALGIKVGANDLTPSEKRPTYPIDRVMPGRALDTTAGETYLVEAAYPPAHPFGRISLQPADRLAVVAAWAGDAAIEGCLPESFAYLDIETTGLSGGTGTYAFLVGVGRFESGSFRLAQFFMRDPLEEPAHLLALQEFLGPCETLVTYNGKSFDIPLLATRFTLQGWKPPFKDLHHIDLLHLARRLWRDRLASRTLGNVEHFILGMRRTQDDIPGWMIPQLYSDYLNSGDARPLKGVFYHNEIDVLAMAAMLHHVCQRLDDPFQTVEDDEPADLVGRGRLYESLGRLEEAAQLYRQSLESGLAENLFWEILQRLAAMYKRQGDYTAAIPLWKQAAEHGHVYAHVELAKYYEHQARQYDEARSWAQAAVEVVCAPAFPPYLRRQWLAELKHRLQRVERKCGRQDARPGSSSA